ncbi:MAG: DUF6036 family nucleotidyltransferase [Candidatus Thermoplasmatota archaeon]
MSGITRIFQALSKDDVRYLLIGGLASVLHGVPRTTADIDIAIDPSVKNLRACIKALTEIGLTPGTDRIDEILGLGGTTFLNDWAVDVLTSLPAPFKFEDLFGRCKTVVYEGVRIRVISLEDQIKILQTTKRRRDLEDAEHLQTYLSEGAGE